MVGLIDVYRAVGSMLMIIDNHCHCEEHGGN